MLAFVTMPFMLQGLLGRSVVESGLLMTPWPLAVGCTAPLAGRLADRYSAGILGGIGLAIFAAGLFALSQLGPHPSSLDIVWRMALCGAGFGLFQSPNNRAMVTAAPRERSGAAGGMLATARLLGQTIGAVAVASGFHWLASAQAHCCWPAPRAPPPLPPASACYAPASGACRAPVRKPQPLVDLP